MTTEKLYHYQAQVTAVYDGDTCTVDVDLGMNTWVRNEKLRLYRIDAPEIIGPTKAAGIASRDALRALILGKPVLLQTIKDKKEKYGRYLTEIFVEQAGEWINVNNTLVCMSHATYRDY